MKPTISVIVPAYNEAGYLAGCLEALNAQQTTTAYEVIVVDNNSTDATAQIATRLGARVVREPRPGICEARQRGLNAARGDIIVSTDADAQPPQNWLTQIEHAFATDARIVGVAGSIHYTNAPRWAPIWVGGLFGATQLWYRMFGQPFYVSACNLAFKRSAFEGYNLALNQGGDELDVLRQLRSHGIVAFESSNIVPTSSRRLYRGFVYNILVTFFLYYLLGYSLSRIAKRPVLRHYPAFRSMPVATRISPFYISALTALCSIVLIRLGRTGHLHFTHLPGLHFTHRLRV